MQSGITVCTPHLVIISSDTDTWVYGLGICEAGHINNKRVYVQRGNTNSYININEGTALISNHPVFSTLCLVALYILTRCDYVSSFYRCTKMETFINDLHFVCPNGQFFKMEMGEF